MYLYTYCLSNEAQDPSPSPMLCLFNAYSKVCLQTGAGTKQLIHCRKSLLQITFNWQWLLDCLIWVLFSVGLPICLFTWDPLHLNFNWQWLLDCLLWVLFSVGFPVCLFTWDNLRFNFNWQWLLDCLLWIIFSVGLPVCLFTWDPRRLGRAPSCCGARWGGRPPCSPGRWRGWSCSSSSPSADSASGGSAGSASADGAENKMSDRVSWSFKNLSCLLVRSYFPDQLISKPEFRFRCQRFGGRMPLFLHLFFFIQYSRYIHTIIHPSFINIRWGPSPCLHSRWSQGDNFVFSWSADH